MILFNVIILLSLQVRNPENNRWQYSRIEKCSYIYFSLSIPFIIYYNFNILEKGSDTISKSEKKEKQAGAELCQAQCKLELPKFWFGSVASLKFDCLVETELVAMQL